MFLGHLVLCFFCGFYIYIPHPLCVNACSHNKLLCTLTSAGWFPYTCTVFCVIHAYEQLRVNLNIAIVCVDFMEISTFFQTTAHLSLAWQESGTTTAILWNANVHGRRGCKLNVDVYYTSVIVHVLNSLPCPRRALIRLSVRGCACMLKLPNMTLLLKSCTLDPRIFCLTPGDPPCPGQELEGL